MDSNLAIPSQFSQSGWEVLHALGRGARGFVLLLQRRKDCRSEQHADAQGQAEASELSALKQSTAVEVRALHELRKCRRVVNLQEHFLGKAGDVWARLDFLQGGTLRQFLRARDPRVAMPEDHARFLVREVNAGLVEVHHKGWMHRDVKAENIGFSIPLPDVFVPTLKYHVKLLDFDTAIEIEDGDARPLDVIGTVENMAPEVFSGSYTASADCWSLGIVAYEIIFGYRPFNDVCQQALQDMICKWERYFILPMDADRRQADFIRSLITDAPQRMTSRVALRHEWLDTRNGARETSSLQNSVEVPRHDVSSEPIDLEYRYTDASLKSPPANSQILGMSPSPQPSLAASSFKPTDQTLTGQRRSPTLRLRPLPGASNVGSLAQTSDQAYVRADKRYATTSYAPIFPERQASQNVKSRHHTERVSSELVLHSIAKVDGLGMRLGDSASKMVRVPTESALCRTAMRSKQSLGYAQSSPKISATHFHSMASPGQDLHDGTRHPRAPWEASFEAASTCPAQSCEPQFKDHEQNEAIGQDALDSARVADGNQNEGLEQLHDIHHDLDELLSKLLNKASSHDVMAESLVDKSPIT